MKKFFTLLVALFATLGMFAQDTAPIELYWNNQAPVQTVSNFFNIVTEGTKNATYTFNRVGGDQVTSSNKANCARITSITFTTEAKATIYIYGCVTERGCTFDDELVGDFKNNRGKYIIEGGPEGSTGLTHAAKIENVPAGTHVIEKGCDKVPSTKNKETEICYVAIVYTGKVLTPLSNPVISFDESNGLVSISKVENASSIRYTTDGSKPGAESLEYTDPFTVADGTVVKAIAIGDQESYSDSEIVEKTCLISTGSVEAPVIYSFNGTFAIACSTILSTIEYSLDNETFNSYTIPITLSEDASVYARASRDGWATSVVVEKEVKVLNAVKSDKKVRLSGKTLTLSSDNKVFTGKDDAEGFTITYSNKSFTIGQANVLNEAAIKASNAESPIITLPKGYAASRLTFYSVVNTSTNDTWWNNINGEAFDFANVSMCSTDGNNPDVRVYNLLDENGNPAEGTVSFGYKGDQPFFIIDVDLVAMKEIPVLEYSETSVLFKNGLDEVSSLPTLKNESNVAVVYTSSKPEVATVDENGQVEIVADGTTVISATFDGDDTYMPAEASYTLTVSSGEIVVAYQVPGMENQGTKENGTTTAGTVTVNGVKNTAAYILANGWTSSAANYIELALENSGFLRGDVITITGTTSAEKVCGIYLQSDLSDIIAISDPFAAGTDKPATTMQVTLEKDYDVLYIARTASTEYNGTCTPTKTYVTMISVNRPYYVAPLPEAPSHDMVNVEVTGGKTVTFTLKENRHQVAVKFVKAETETPAEDGMAKAIDHAANGFTLLEGDPNTNTITYDIPNEDGTLHYYAYDPETDLASESQTLDVVADPTISTSLSKINAEAGEVEYFNLQGIRVAEPVGGVFIRKQGSQVTKVVK